MSKTWWLDSENASLKGRVREVVGGLLVNGDWGLSVRCSVQRGFSIKLYEVDAALYFLTMSQELGSASNWHMFFDSAYLMINNIEGNCENLYSNLPTTKWAREKSSHAAVRNAKNIRNGTEKYEECMQMNGGE